MVRILELRINTVIYEVNAMTSTESSTGDNPSGVLKFDDKLKG